MNNELPIQLYKANAELQLQITRLLQESGHCWLEAMQQLSAGSVEETTARIQGLQQAADWQALATLPSEVFRCLYQGRVGDAQAIAQTTAKSQAAFVDGLRQALRAGLKPLRSRRPVRHHLQLQLSLRDCRSGEADGRRGCQRPGAGQDVAPPHGSPPISMGVVPETGATASTIATMSPIA